MEENSSEKIIIAAILIALSVLSFFLLRPILMSIILGFVLVFVFAPLYNLIHRKIKSKNLSSSITTLILLGVIIVPTIFLLPVIVSETIKIFTFAQQIDFVTPIESLFPSLSGSGVFPNEVDSILHTFITNVTTGMVNSVFNFLLNIPIILLQMTVVLFTFFFVMRDKNEFIDYLRSILPFPKDVQEKLLKATKDVTASVLYGQIVIGFFQGLIAGLGFFLFGVPNAILLMVLAILAGVLPIVGPSIIWIPVAIYLVVTGNNFAGIGVTIFGIASIIADNFLRPIVISRRLMMNSLLALLGTIGGIIFFGVMGLILGPLIIAYLLILLEVYRNKRFSGLLIKAE